MVLALNQRARELRVRQGFQQFQTLAAVWVEQPYLMLHLISGQATIAGPVFVVS